MPTEFRLPELGENIENGDLLRLMVSVGDSINADQPVLELETDKATIEVPSTVSGKVRAIHVKAGDKVRRGQALAVLEAMKMEHTLSAPADETVESVGVSAGDQVAEGTIVVRFARENAA